MDISQLRNEYTRAELDEKTVLKSPIEQFRKWFKEAVATRLIEPNAMILSTVDKENQPFQRTVLLKAYDESGFVFYTNYTSRKAKQIDENNFVSLLFPWYGLERQVAIRGIVERISTAQSARYFLSRPFGSQLGAWVSHQSQVITSRSLLEIKMNEMKQKFKDGKVPAPDFWGGFRVSPISLEFWQGRSNRLHDRILYEKVEDRWKISRLSP